MLHQCRALINHAVGFDDEGDVIYDVGLADTLRQDIIIMGK